MGKRKARKQKLEMAVTHIHRRFGPRSLVKGRLPTTDGFASPVPHIPTGFPALDRALGIGGLPQGRITELIGFGTAGKTTLALKFLAQAQAAGHQVGYVDQARYFDPDYAHRCGLDLSRLLVGTPYGLQEALDMTQALVQSKSLSALVFDALDVFWVNAASAQRLTALLNRLTPTLARSGTALLFLRASISNDAADLPGLAHHAAIRLQLARERWLRRRGHNDVRGYETRVEILKNQLGPAGRAVKVAIDFNGTVRGNGL
jgi:recombination protein RecA